MREEALQAVMHLHYDFVRNPTPKVVSRSSMRFSAKIPRKGRKKPFQLPAFLPDAPLMYSMRATLLEVSKGVMPGQPFVLPELAPEHFHRNLP